MAIIQSRGTKPLACSRQESNKVIIKENLYNADPNLSIVLDGCNADCSFCYDKSIRNVDNILFNSRLSSSLKNLPDDFYQVSITGGEPTIHSNFINLADIITKASNFKKVVLTTNGSKLIELKDYISTFVNHINISRHHYDDDENSIIFKGDNKSSYKSLTSLDLSKIVIEYNKLGIDISLNCYIDNSGRYDSLFIENYIMWARSIGITHIKFRLNSSLGLEKSDVEKEFSSYKYMSDDKCDVCRSAVMLIAGCTITWHNSVNEPVERTDKIYELVYKESNLYLDWSKKKPLLNYLNIKSIPDNYIVKNPSVKEWENSLLNDMTNVQGQGMITNIPSYGDKVKGSEMYTPKPSSHPRAHKSFDMRDASTWPENWEDEYKAKPGGGCVSTGCGSEYAIRKSIEGPKKMSSCGGSSCGGSPF